MDGSTWRLIVVPIARRRVTIPERSRLCSAARIVVRLTRIIFERSRSGGRRSSSKRPARMASRIASRTCSGRGAFSSSTSTIPYSSPTAARMSAGSLRVA